jgi:hypothetical protein
VISLPASLDRMAYVSPAKMSFILAIFILLLTYL